MEIERLNLKLLLVVTLSFVLQNMWAATYSGGDGTIGDPYQIATKADLLELDTTTQEWGAGYHYIITANIDMEGDTIKPIGYGADAGDPMFWGTVDGQNHVITNVVVNPKWEQTDDYRNEGIGLFGSFGGTMQNLGVDSIIVMGGSFFNRVGGLAGQLLGNETIVRNCFVIRGHINGFGWVGGIAGVTWATLQVSNCFVSADLTASWGSAGILGNRQGACSVDSVAFYGTINSGDAISTNTNGTVSHAYYISTCGVTDTEGTQLTPGEMTEQTNYTFDFNTIWTMKPEGYAVLSSFPLSVYNAMPGNDVNLAPVAEAGPAQIVDIGVEVTLDGSGSYDPELEDITYLWEAPSQATLSSTTVASPTFTAPAVLADSNLVFYLTVNDGVHDSETDSVTITILVEGVPTDTLDQASWSVIYTSSITASQPGELSIDDDIETKWFTDWASGTDAFPLEIQYDMGRTGEITDFIYHPRQDAFGPNGTIKGYEIYISDNSSDWGTAVKTGELDWPEYNGSNAESFKEMRLISLGAPVDGRYIRIVATSAVTDPAQVGIAELYAFGTYHNSAPVADAGENQSVLFGTLVTLDGSASSDIDDDDLTFLWTAPDGITLSDATSATPTFTAPTVTNESDYTFSLVVNDGELSSDASQVVITVKTELSIESIKDTDILVYPNPSDGVFYIATEKASFGSIIDIVGRNLVHVTLKPGRNQLDLSSLSKGIYFLVLNQNNDKNIIKLQVSR